MVVSSIPITKRGRRDSAIDELLNSESDYVSDLKLLVDVFLMPLERWAKDLEADRESVYDFSRMDDHSPERWAPDFTLEDCNKIFANTLQLTRFHRQFLVDLRRAHGGPSGQDRPGLVSPVSNAEDWRKVTTTGRGAMEVDDSGKYEGVGEPFQQPAPDRGPRQMLETFLKSAPFLKMYSEYVNNFDAARERLATLERENLSFSAFLTACEKQKPCRGLHLRDFLILPVQRIPRYRLLLENILQHSASESSAPPKADESVSTMGGIASRIGADLSLQQRKNQLYRLQQEFGGASFVTSSRLFVREGDLFKVARNGVEKLHFVLFNDLLVYGQAKRRRGLLSRGGEREQLYHHRRDINLSKCFVVDAPSYGSRCSSFLGETGMLVVSEEKSFMVMASTAVEKDGWLRAFRLCMRELSTNAEAREGLYGSNKILSDAGLPQQQLVSGLSPGSSPSSSRWSITSAHSVLAASAPRSVWVPASGGSDRTSSFRVVDFRLPAWAGVRTSCGCLSHTELIWGKDRLALPSDVDGETMGFGAGAGSASGVRARTGYSPARIGRQISDDPPYDPQQFAGALLSSGVDTDSPRKVSLIISMKPLEPMGLRLRDLHPECGGGVVVVGFQRSAAGKKAGVKQGDRITKVDGISVSNTADIVWALQQQLALKGHASTGRGSSSGSGNDGVREVHLVVLRGFPKSKKPWMPRLTLEPSPTGTFPTPPSSAVDSPGRDSDMGLPSPELSAPGKRTFSGIGASGNTLSFAGGVSGGGVASCRQTPVLHRRDEQQPLSAATVRSTSRTAEGMDMLVVASAPAPPSLETVLSAPGEKTFSGVAPSDGKSASNGRGFGFLGSTETPTADHASRRQRMYGRSSTAATVMMCSTDSGMTAAAPPSPEEPKSKEGSRDGGDSNGTGGDSTDSIGGGRASRGPAPTQANVNAGGDPAVPFMALRSTNVVTTSRQGIEQSSPGLGVGEELSTGTGLGSRAFGDENSRPNNLELNIPEDMKIAIHEMPSALLADTSRGTSPSTVAAGSMGDDCSVAGSVGKKGDNGEEFHDTLSVASGSSSRSSLHLAAVSPSRIPPPLVSVASTLPLPPVSRASSVRSGSSSNPWRSPSSVDALEDLNSLNWLKPLPPPPPSQQQQQQQQLRLQDAPKKLDDLGPFFASAATLSTRSLVPQGEVLQQKRAEPKI